MAWMQRATPIVDQTEITKKEAMQFISEASRRFVASLADDPAIVDLDREPSRFRVAAVRR
jgi:hypothetical protein